MVNDQCVIKAHQFGEKETKKVWRSLIMSTLYQWYERISHIQMQRACNPKWYVRNGFPGLKQNEEIHKNADA